MIAGKDKGRVGKVLRIERENDRIIVERINLIKKHQKATDASQPGQIISEGSNTYFQCYARLP